MVGTRLRLSCAAPSGGRPYLIVFMKLTQILFILFLVATTVTQSGSASAGEYMQLPGVVHVHSSFSSGKYSIGELVSRAENKGLEVLILTDHDQVVMEYGLFPFRNLIRACSIIKIQHRADFTGF
jgi:hypothetical protein